MPSDVEILQQILSLNNTEFPQFGPLMQVRLLNTNSRLLHANDDRLWVFPGYGLEGLFRKDQDDTFAYGRRHCDLIKDVFSCHGFFTSDELPRYGIGRTAIAQLFEQTDKKAGDGTLLFLLAYDQVLSEKIRQYLIDHITNEATQPDGRSTTDARTSF